eukprot:2264914-Ditylum_brightwellii.AAC.1
METTPHGIKFNIPSQVCHQETPTQVPPSNFTEYVDSLETWEKELISGTEMVIEEEDICEVLTDEITMFLVSNGGAENGFGYFR